MFTGIVEEIGSIKTIESDRLDITASVVLDDLKAGDSVSVNGACLTVTNLHESYFSVNIVPETIRRTNLGQLCVDSGVNLERAIQAVGRFGGHIVQGHVDTTGRVSSIVEEADALLIAINTPRPYMKYIVEKGFITVDGTSLTVVNCEMSIFTVTIVPYTKENTIFGSIQVDDSVNLEVDILAKYVESLTKMPKLLN